MRTYKMVYTAFVLVLSLIVTVVSAESKKPVKEELDSALATIPKMPTSGTWPNDVAFGRFDTLKRGSKKQLFGRWALSIDDACSGVNNFSSIPPEEDWDGDVIGHYCPDKELAFEVHLRLAASGGKGPNNYIKLFCGASGGCDGLMKNQRVKNTHDKKAIKATFEWRSLNGSMKTTIRKLEPGEISTITYCNCGDVKVVGARYVK